MVKSDGLAVRLTRISNAADGSSEGAKDVIREAATRIIALEAERDRLHTALVMIAHTETENSFGGSQNMPSNWYRDQARAALTP